METFLKQGFSKSNLKSLNKVRLHLEAFTLSDICTGNGEEITTSAWTGLKREADNRHGQYNWPNYEKVCRNDRQIWSQALSVCYCNRRDRKLDTPIGLWTQPPTQAWKWYLHMENSKLYRRTDKGWKSFELQGRSIIQPRYNKEETDEKVIETKKLLRTTVIVGQDFIFTEGTASYIKEHDKDKEMK